jgi:ubiquinol-cytochrome c reductase iron-sulfur subunit
VSGDLEKRSAAELEELAPGLPAHVHRRTDVDPRAARRAERQVATMFGLSMVFIVLFVVAFVAIDPKAVINTGIPGIGEIGAFNAAIGACIGFALFLVGAGAIHWARKLMSDEEVVAERHEPTSDEPTRQQVIDDFMMGAEESGFAKRPIIRRTLIGAMLLLPLPAIVLLRDLGPLPGTKLRETLWEPGLRIVQDITFRPIRPDEIPVGGLVATAVPINQREVTEEDGNFNELAKSIIILVRMAPEEIRSQQIEDGDYQGILAFSKVCTHSGCAIALYEQRTKHLLCPCHQSTFDLADDGNVIFGPAARRIPQLAITVDEDGYLVAREGFREPVGPSFWERG